MLYVGVKQQNLPALRESLEATDVGDTGHIEVYGGTGAMAGTVVISPEGARDGENMLEATDADGATYVQQMVGDGAAAGRAHVRYVDPEAGPTTVRLTYYAPWDWVIATVARDRDFSVPSTRSPTVARPCSSPWSWRPWSSPSSGARLVLGRTAAHRAAAAPARPHGRDRRRRGRPDPAHGRLPPRRGRPAVGANRFVDKVAGTVRDIGRCAGRWRRRRRVCRPWPTASPSAPRAAGPRRRAPRRRGGDQHGRVRRRIRCPGDGGLDLEIARSAAEAAEVGRQAADLAQKTEGTIAALGASSAEIGDVVKVISGVAEQTNLLALNATNDRGGARGRRQGFAVVANEVKEPPRSEQGQRGDRPAGAGASRPRRRRRSARSPRSPRWSARSTTTRRRSPAPSRS